MIISAVFPHSHGYCTEVILVVLHRVLHGLLFLFFFLFVVVHCVIHHSVDFIVFCMPVSVFVSLGMICLYAVIALNQINKYK